MLSRAQGFRVPGLCCRGFIKVRGAGLQSAECEVEF